MITVGVSRRRRKRGGWGGRVGSFKDSSPVLEGC